MNAPERPLVALLGHAHDALEAAFDDRLAASEFSDLSLAHSRNVLRHLDRQDCSRASQVVERSGVSKQAVSQQIAQLEKAGYVTVAPDPTDRRARQLLLTERGIAAQKVVRRILGELDAEWRGRWGQDDWQRVRARLVEVMAWSEGQVTSQ